MDKKKYNNAISAILVGLCLAMAFLYVQPIRMAEAASFTIFDSGTGAAQNEGIIRMGTKIFVGDATNSLVTALDATSKAVLGTITGVTTPYILAPNSAGNRVYAYGAGATLFELDPVNYAVLRTLATGCDSIVTQGAAFDEINDTFYCTTSTDTIKRIALASMSVTFTSTTVNAGAIPCVTPRDIEYDSATDTLFIGCDGPSRIVAIEGLTASGTPDFAVSYTSPRSIAWNTDQNNIAVCSNDVSTAVNLYNYTFGGGFTLFTTMLSAGSTCAATGGYENMVYDTVSNRFIATFTTDNVGVFDATTGATLFNQIVTSGVNAGQTFVYSTTLAYGIVDDTSPTTNVAYEFDMTGIASGTGAGSVVGASLCYVDTNFDGIPNIVYRDIGGPDGVPDRAGQGGVPDGVCDAGFGITGGSILTGGQNVTEVTTNIGCLFGLLSCDEFGQPNDPNPATNGMGLLLVIILLIIAVGMLTVASKGQLAHIHPVVWAIVVVGILAVAFSFGWIELQYLLLAIFFSIAFVALRLIPQVTSSISGGSSA